MKKISPIFLAVLSVFVVGFDFSKHSIPTDEIFSGGVARDAIPSLTDPKFVPAEEADFIKDPDRVIGVVMNGRAKAYPIKILNWHEAVNDEAGGVKFLVTW
jgi:hypothetical protein